MAVIPETWSGGTGYTNALNLDYLQVASGLIGGALPTPDGAGGLEYQDWYQTIVNDYTSGKLGSVLNVQMLLTYIIDIWWQTCGAKYTRSEIFYDVVRDSSIALPFGGQVA